MRRQCVTKRTWARRRWRTCWVRRGKTRTASWTGNCGRLVRVYTRRLPCLITRARQTRLCRLRRGGHSTCNASASTTTWHARMTCRPTRSTNGCTWNARCDRRVRLRKARRFASRTRSCTDRPKVGGKLWKSQRVSRASAFGARTLPCCERWTASFTPRSTTKKSSSRKM